MKNIETILVVGVLGLGAYVVWQNTRAAPPTSQQATVGGPQTAAPTDLFSMALAAVTAVGNAVSNVAQTSVKTI